MHELRLLKANINQLKDLTSLEELSVAGAAVKPSPHKEQEVQKLFLVEYTKVVQIKYTFTFLEGKSCGFVPEFSHNPYLSSEKKYRVVG